MAPSVPRKKRKTSLVWKFYRKPADPNAAEIHCHVCSVPLRYKGSTYGISYHLKTQHAAEYNNIIKSEAQASGSLEADYEEAEMKLARSFATGLIPFKFVENPEFREFLNAKPLDFVIPRAAKIRDLIVGSAKEYTEILKQEFKNVKSYALLTDGYTDLRRGFSFYSVHISYVNQDFERKMRFCSLRTVESGDTTSISTAICEVLNAVGLVFTNCSVVTSDAASPLISLSGRHDIDRIHCSCHLFNLVIKDFAELPAIRNIQMRIQNFAKHISMVKTDKKNLKAMSVSLNVKSPLPLPLPATRWGALPLLAQQYLDHYESAKNLSQLQKYILKPDEINKVKRRRLG